jgi:catalase
VLFDAVVIPDGEAGVRALSAVGHAVEFVKDQYRHCKTILALGTGDQLLGAAAVPAAERSRGDPGILRMADGAKATRPFIAAVARHRHFDRQTDPPLV